MNSKMIIAVVVVAIVVVAGVSICLVNNNDGDEKTSKGSGRLLVYGNVDNDDYLDNDDLNKLNEILEDQANGTAWDEETYPFADVNNDGSVDQSDVTYLQNILNKENTIMYYVSSYGTPAQFHYPAGDRLIACSSDYGLNLCQILDVYDKVKAGSSKTEPLSEARYPGVKSLQNLGTYASGSYETFVENFLDSECSILMGQVTESVYNLILNSGKEADLILLSSSAEIQSGGIDVVSNILTCGILLDKGDEARDYVAYFDDMVEYLSENTSSLEEKTFLLIYNPSNAVTCTIHTHGDNGSWKGDAWTMNYLPMTTEFQWNGSAANGKSNGVEVETVLDLDPDVIIISAWNKISTDTSVEDAKAIYQEMAEYFSKTTAYKTGNIYGVCYETYGTYLGVGGLALLASYIWPDSFSEEEGWDKLQEVIDRYTMIEADVKTLGGIVPIKVGAETS